MLVNLGRRCDAAFRQAVLRKCYDALSVAGFVRFRKGGLDWPLHGGFHCWVGLDSVLEPEHLAINPFVGVHVVTIMKFCAALERGKYHRSVSTYALDMGELKSREPIFRFTRHSDIDAVVARLVRLYKSAGLAYARSIGNYESLLPLLQSRVGMLGQYPQRTAACLYLMGRKDEARSFTETILARHRGHLEAFAVPFMELLDRESAGDVTGGESALVLFARRCQKQHARGSSTRMDDDVDVRNYNKNRHTFMLRKDTDVHR